MVTSWIVVVLFLQILQVSCQSLSSDILAISNGIGLSSKSINIFKNDTWSDSQLIKELFLEGYTDLFTLFDSISQYPNCQIGCTGL